MRRICLVLLILVFGLSMTAVASETKAVNVTGDWNMSMMTPMGESKCTLSFVQDGEKVTVKMTDPMGVPIEAEATITGNEVSWSAASQTPMGEMMFEYKGTVEGDEIKGTATMVDMGMPPSEWTATR